MKPFHFFILALALVLLAAPILAPTTSANAGIPVSDDSKSSIYRAWSDFIVGYGTGQYDFDANGNLSAIVELNIVAVAGKLQTHVPPRPYLSSVWVDDYVGTVIVNAEYDICWLDSSLNKQTYHFTPQGSSGTNNAFGNMHNTLYRDFPGLTDFGNAEGIETDHGKWLEDIIISVYVPHPSILNAGLKVAEYRSAAAYCEQITLMGDYTADASPDWQITDIWNHPSVTSALWQGALVGGTWYGTGNNHYEDSMAYDWERNAAIIEGRSTDDAMNRSALYGYAQSIKGRVTSVYNWQAMIDEDLSPSPHINPVVNGRADLDKALALSYSAWVKLDDIQKGIVANGDFNQIKAAFDDALTDYQLAILYTDRAIILDAEITAIGDDGPEELRAAFLDTEIMPYIDQLEGGRLTFSAWLLTPMGAVLAGSTAALGVVAAYWRSGIAGILAVLAALMSAMIWATEAGL